MAEDDGILPILYALLAGLIALALLLIFSSPTKPPKWHKALCAVGFVVSIGWISSIADEVVGILRAFGAILGVSEAILGVTVFAVVRSFFLFHLTSGQLAVRFCSRCDGCQNGLSDDGHVGLFRWTNAKYLLHPCNLTPDILLGVGVAGLFMNLTTEPVYNVSLSATLLVSTVSLFLTLSSMLIFVPFNKWRMTRSFGIGLVTFFTLSTVASVIVEIVL